MITHKLCLFDLCLIWVNSYNDNTHCVILTFVWTEWTYIMITHILCYFVWTEWNHIHTVLFWPLSELSGLMYWWHTHCVILTFVWTEWTHIMITHILCFLDLCLNWVNSYNDITHTVLIWTLSDIVWSQTLVL